jgi:hypothetical protein
VKSALLATASLVSLFFAYALGTLNLSGVEPPGLSFVPCGPAVFGRLNPLPHPTCERAFLQLELGFVVFGANGLLLAIMAVWIHKKRRGSRW